LKKPPDLIITILLLIALALQFSVLPLRAQQPPFKIYTTEEGLAHDSVNKIVRDSRGFLWFCTSEGLSRFDGSRFTNFTQEHGLPHRNVTTFLETRDGTYLVGTSHGLVVFNPNGRAYRWNVFESRLEKDSAETPMFQTLAPETANRHQRSIRSLAEDADGTIWVGTGVSLYQVEKKNDDWKFSEFVIDRNVGIGFHDIVADSKGGVVIASSHGVFRIFRGRLEILADKGAGSIMEDHDGRIWIGASGEPTGLRIFQFDNDRLKLAQTYRAEDGLAHDTFHNSLKQLSDGRVFVGLATGLHEFVPDAEPNQPKFRSLNSDIIISLADDSSGNLWIGTELKGAWQMVRNGFFSFGEREGISASEDIRAVYFDTSGGIFLPTRPQKVLYAAENGKFQSIIPFGVKKRSWGWHFLDFQSADGEWWIPTSDGLYRYPKVAHFADLAHTPPKRIYTVRDGLWRNETFNLFEDSRGDIWIATVGGDNVLSRWERETDKLHSYSDADNLPKSNGAIAFAEDRQGSIWLGHFFGLLARYRHGKFQIFTEKDGLPETQISDLLTDSSGRLWIATSGRGVFRVDETEAENPVFTNISSHNGLSSSQVICLTEDRFKQVYIGTGRGINRVDAGGHIRVFTQADGLPSNYITRCATDKKGDLWFVSQNILVRYKPEIERSLLPPPVFVDKISVNGVRQKISALGETRIELPDLAANETQIQIDFFALTFGIGENIRYQYRFNDQEWSSPSDQQTLNLNLGPGRHFFAVRAVRSDGVPGEKTATVSFKILSPLWLRWWFITIGVLLLGLIIFLFYRYRISNLRAINEALAEAKRAEEQLSNSRAERIAELERVRSRIATDLHDDIGASLTQIAILSEVAQAQSRGNGATESLSKITDVSNELVGTMSDIVWSINPSKDHLSDLTQRMRRFASDSLSASGIIFQFNSTEIDQEIVVKSHLRREVFLIFKESINNIVKHSKATQVEVRLQISDEFLTLKITDNGRGFDSEKDYENSFSSISMGKNGILSMQKRAAEMNGELEIVSRRGSGTTVELKLPMEIGQTQAPNKKEGKF
jgi:signal transduction histidine kinase/ligand-binding sensor domain-containing protein